ncbi:MAG: aldo/keto reductase [Novosphingobium sp.]|nr:aldo/keto reductase [Novosphingobium sp.]
MIDQSFLDRLGPVGFGAASLGNLFRRIPDADARDAITSALKAGISYVDTAPFYGFGLSERRVGDALREWPGIIVSTKVGRLLRPAPGADTSSVRDGYATPLPFEPVFDYSYDAIMRSYEASLQRLGLARIDILYVHDIGRATHGADSERHWRDLFGDRGGYAALDELRRTGAVRAIGLGVNEWEVCVEAMCEGRFDLFMLAGRYTLLDQSSLDSFMPACAAHGARVVIAGVYNSGILASGSAGTPIYDYVPAPSTIVERVRRIEAHCGNAGISLPAAAMQFVRAHPLTVTVVPGIASERRLAQTMALLDEPIPASFWAALKADGLLRADAPTPTDGV